MNVIKKAIMKPRLFVNPGYFRPTVNSTITMGCIIIIIKYYNTIMHRYHVYWSLYCNKGAVVSISVP